MLSITLESLQTEGSQMAKLHLSTMQLDVTTVSHGWLALKEAQQSVSTLSSVQACRHDTTTRYVGFYLRVMWDLLCWRPRWLNTTGWWWFVHIQTQPGTTTQHISFHWNNRLHLWRVPGGPGHCHNDAAKANEKWKAPFSVFLLSRWDRCRTHDWLAERMIRSTNYQLRHWNTMHFAFVLHCYTLLERCIFSSQNRRDEHRQCLPSWKCIPLGIPNMRQTNILTTIH